MAAPLVTLEEQTKPLTEVLHCQWNAIVAKMAGASQMQSQCTHPCDVTVVSTKECPIVQRLIFIMQFHSSWIHANVSSSSSTITKENEAYLSVSLSAFISSLPHYSITQLINDWHHLRQYHWETLTQQYQTREYFQSVVQNNCEDLADCIIFTRVNRDREQTKSTKSRNKTYFIRGNDEHNSLEVTTQQLCDCIHDWIFHIPIIPLLTKSASQQDSNDKEHKTNANNSDEDWDYDASEIALVRSLRSNTNDAMARKKAIAKLQNGDKYFQHSKFVTNTTEFEANNTKNANNKFNTMVGDDEKKTDANASMASSVMASPSYEFGIEMMYSEEFKQFARYKSIRDEVLNDQNKQYSLTMHQWEDTVTKAEHYANSVFGKTIKATVKDDDLNIKMDDPLTTDALIACLLYTNFTDLQRKFSSSTRRYSHQQSKTDNDIRIEHYRDYYSWGQALMVSIKCYGQKMNETMSFYHGINTELVFADFTAYFNCPTSTTGQLSVAALFASDQGIILSLSGKIKGGGKAKFMNVSWFSDYPNEDERLLYGYHNQLEILSIYTAQFNYVKFIRALKVFDILTDPFTGAETNRKYARLGDVQNRRKYCDYLLSMVKKTVDIEQYNAEIKQQKQNKKLKRKKWRTKEIPQYMMNIFNYFLVRQTAVTFDVDKLNALNHVLTTYFLIRQESLDTVDGNNDVCLNFSILLKLFPNATSFRLHFGAEAYALKPAHFEFLCECVSKAVHMSMDVTPTESPINIVEFKGLESTKGIKTSIKKMKAQYFSNGLFTIQHSRLFKTVQFVKYTKDAPHYEDIFIGNLYQVNKDKRSWTMFISKSKEKLVVPKSVQQVTYYLDKKLYNKQEITVDKSPFSLKRKVRDAFVVRLKITFRGKRYPTWYCHPLSFDHPVSMSNLVCQAESEKTGCKHGEDYILHSDNIGQYDYWACKRTDGATFVIGGVGI
eukprot:103357_1